MAQTAERPKIDLAYLLEKYGPKSKKKKPEVDPYGRPKKQEYLPDGFCIKFRLSRAYRQLERQEVEAAKPDGLPLRRRRRKKGIMISGDKVENQPPKTEKLEKAREKMVLKTSHAPTTFWRQLIMSKTNKDEVKKDDKTDKASVHQSAKSGSVRENDTPDVERKSTKSLTSNSRAVEEWERRRKVRIEENKEKREKLKSASSPAMMQQFKYQKKRPERQIQSASTSRAHNSPMFQRPGSARSRQCDQVPVITLRKPKHIIGQPLRKYDEVNPDPFEQLLNFNDKKFIWPKTSSVSGQMVPGGEETSKYIPDMFNGLDNESDGEKSRPQSAGAQSRVSELEAIVSSTREPEGLQVYLPDPNAVNTEDQDQSDHLHPESKSKEIAFKEKGPEDDIAGDEGEEADEDGEESEESEEDPLSQSARKDEKKPEESKPQKPEETKPEKPTGILKMPYKIAAKDSKSAESQQPLKSALAQSTKDNGGKEIDPNAPVLRPVRFLYNMEKCEKVAQPETLEKLGKKKKKKVVGVINVYGCKKEEHIKKYHEKLSKSHSKKKHSHAEGLEEDVKCPFCTTKPEKRIQNWLAGVENQ